MADRPLTRQEEQSRQKKEQIYQTALELFNTYGYEQTTIRQICAAAHVTTGSFYNFFKDKLGLIRQLHVQILAEGRSILDPTDENLSHPFQSIFDYFMKNTAIFGEFRQDVAQQILADSARIMSGEYDAPYEETGKGAITGFIRKAQEYGSISAELDAEKTTIYLMAVSMGWSHYWILRSRNMSLREAAELILLPAFSAVTNEEIICRDVR